MKIELDKTYLKYSFHIILTATILYILYSIISNAGTILQSVLSLIGGILSLLAPFIIGFVIAYLIRPLTNLIEKHLMHRGLSKPLRIKKDPNLKTKRTVSVLLTYIIVLGLIVLFFYSVYVMIGGQITQNLDINSMIDSIMNYTQRYNTIFQDLVIKLETSGLSTDAKQQLMGVLNKTNAFVGASLTGIFDFVKRLGGNLFNLLLGFIIAFYLLKDEDYFMRLANDVKCAWFKGRQGRRVDSFLVDVNRVVANFIRGQLLDAIIVGILSSIALMFVGIDFAVLIGMTAGICNIIPYFGPIIGSVPAVIVGLLSGSPIKALFAVLALLLVQQLDSIVISPKIVGDSVGLHPVFVILSIIIGGSLFGLFGMLLAVPTAGIIKLIFLRWINYYKRISADGGN